MTNKQSNVPKTELCAGESVVRQGAANLQRGLESVGGRLFLTNQRLLFEAHKVNVQSEPLHLDIDAIRDVVGGWTKFLGVLPLVPNALVVTVGDGDPVRFTVYGKAKWIEAIRGSIAAN